MVGIPEPLPTLSIPAPLPPKRRGGKDKEGKGSSTPY